MMTIILNGDGTFNSNSNKDKWGGITKSISTSNFEEANVEFIQFWVMDPFSEKEDDNHSGFKLYFNLGNISEDILKDGRKSFENGLPEDGNFLGPNVEETKDASGNTIAYVPKNKQDLANAFAQSSIPLQDLGIDGMSDDVERDKFSSFVNKFSPNSKVWQDPSGDNFLYYRSRIHDNENAGVIKRYKRFNNPQGNTSGSTMPAESYPVSAKNNPDTEDINRDQSLNTTDSYFEYEVPINRANLNIDNNPYITDILEANVEAPNGIIKNVKWYQFKIPINSPNKKSIGGISDFRSIRFVRMYITDSEDPVLLRFAELKFMRSEWRKYTKDFNSTDEEGDISPTSITTMEVGTVNIEENSSRQPSPYVLPPGIERQEGYTNTNIIRQNEQSLSLKVKDLRRNDSRAIFKETKFDFRRYSKIKMFSHLEAIKSATLNDDDISLFIRIGGDLNINYYEYEIPLKVSKIGASLPQDIWLESNNLDLDLSKLQDIKIARDKAVKNGTSSSRDRFSLNDGKNKIYIKGFPNYSSVKKYNDWG